MGCCLLGPLPSQEGALALRWGAALRADWCMCGRRGEGKRIDSGVKDERRNPGVLACTGSCGLRIKATNQNWSTAPGSVASRAGFMLTFIFVCVCEHEREFPPARTVDPIAPESLILCSALPLANGVHSKQASQGQKKRKSAW